MKVSSASWLVYSPPEQIDLPFRCWGVAAVGAGCLRFPSGWSQHYSRLPLRDRERQLKACLEIHRGTCQIAANHSAGQQVQGAGASWTELPPLSTGAREVLTAFASTNSHG